MVESKRECEGLDALFHFIECDDTPAEQVEIDHPPTATLRRCERTFHLQDVSSVAVSSLDAYSASSNVFPSAGDCESAADSKGQAGAAGHTRQDRYRHAQRDGGAWHSNSGERTERYVVLRQVLWTLVRVYRVTMLRVPSRSYCGVYFTVVFFFRCSTGVEFIGRLSWPWKQLS